MELIPSDAVHIIENVEAPGESRWIKSPFAALLIASAIGFLILAAGWIHWGSFDFDSGWYYKMASGGSTQIEKPYANRLLYPFFARIISRATGLDLYDSFRLASLFSVFLLTLAVVFTLRAEASNPLLALPLLFTPYLLDIFQHCYMPDLFHTALLGFFFLTLIRQKLWPAWCLLLILLFLTRESTILVSLILILAAFLRSKRINVIRVIVAAAAGLALSAALTRSAQSNVHQVGNVLYMALKVPFNFSLNFLGFKVWLNTLKDIEQPLFQVALPAWLHIGAVTEIGLCPWQPTYPLRTLLAWLTTFGLAPTFIAFTLSKHRKAILKASSFWTITVVLYGLVSFIIGPLLGPAVVRLIGYGWPAFWLGAPIILMAFFNVPKSSIAPLVLIQVALSWVPILLPPIERESLVLMIAAVLGAGFLQLLGLREIRRLEFRPPERRR
jgi:hypothetical protein